MKFLRKLFRRKKPVVPGTPFVFQVNLDGSKRYFASFLEPGAAFGSGIPTEGIIGEVQGPQAISPETFEPNPVFGRFLAWVIAKHATQCPPLMDEARRIGTGTVVVVDHRTLEPDGSVPAEDVIGVFEVEDGAPVRYHGSPNHQLLSKNGFLQLDPFILDRLLEELAALRPSAD